MAGRYGGETAVGISAAVRAGLVTPAEVLEQHLERIAAVESGLARRKHCGWWRRQDSKRKRRDEATLAIASILE